MCILITFFTHLCVKNVYFNYIFCILLFAIRKRFAIFAQNQNSIMKIAVTNLKGGVGKTTIAINLAVALTQRGKSVCIIDTDKNQNSAVEWSMCRAEERNIIQVFSIEPEQIKVKTLNDLEQKFDILL